MIAKIVAFAAALAVVAYATQPPESIVDLFQKAYKANSHWMSPEFRNPPAITGQHHPIVILRAFIGLFMNRVRIESTDTNWARFVDNLPIHSEPIDHLFKAASPYYAEPSPQHPAALPPIDLSGVFNCFLPGSQSDSEPSIDSPLITAKIVLDLFGSEFRKVLYSSDNGRNMQRLITFIKVYIDHMAKCDIHELIALAMLARDLILVEERNMPSEFELEPAGLLLRRTLTCIDGKSDLEHPTVMMDTPAANYSRKFACVEMPWELVLDLFTYSLNPVHAEVRDMSKLVRDLAVSFKTKTNERKYNYLQQMAVIMAVTGSESLLSQIVEHHGPISLDVKNQSLCVLAVIAIAFNDHQKLIEEICDAIFFNDLQKLIEEICAGDCFTSAQVTREELLAAIPVTLERLLDSMWNYQKRGYFPALGYLDRILPPHARDVWRID